MKKQQQTWRKLRRVVFTASILLLILSLPTLNVLAAQPNIPNLYSGNLSVTEVYDNTYSITLYINDLGGASIPTSNWYDPHGVQLSVTCGTGNLIREGVYVMGVLVQYKDYFYIDGCFREPGLYYVIVGSDINLTFTILDSGIPKVSSITRLDPNPTNASSVDFSVTFSEAVTGVDTGDFSLTTTGVSGAFISSITDSGDQITYTASVDTGSDDGTIRLDLNSSGTGIQDLTGNPINGGFTIGEVYDIQRNMPDIEIAPVSLSNVQLPDAVQSEILTVANLGNVDLDWMFVGAGNIVGDWALNYDWGCNGVDGTSTINFYSDGTFSTSSGSSGTWTQISDQVQWIFTSGTTYDGTISNNYMSGTMVSSTSTTGCWDATRITAAMSNVLLDHIELEAEGGGCVLPADIPWLDIDPLAGTILPLGNTDVLVTYDSTGLSEGIYDANLCIASNDPNELLIIVPVTLQVLIDTTPPTISDITDKSTNEDTATGNIAFTVGDVETPAASLIVTASSSNTTLVPNGNITLGGSGTDRTLNLTPASNQSGTTTITVTVDDGTDTASDTFLLTVNAVNDPPTISDITNKSTNEDTATGSIAFTVGDVETPAASLIVTASSSNTTLVPNGNITLGGSGTDRTLNLTPASNQSGTTTITVTVDDGADTTSDTFLLTVNAINDPPTISDITDKTTNEDTATGNIAFTVGDVETPATSLIVTASSSNTTLVPNGNISLGGSGTDRTLNITPASNQSGTTTITVTVDDGTDTTSDTFLLTVVVTNPPTYALIVSLTGTGSGTIMGNGIDCGTDCTETYTEGTVVTLTATPSTGSAFTGWSGACTGGDNCVVTMTEAKSVTATFDVVAIEYRIYLPLIIKNYGNWIKSDH